jgi:hypothetical protein
MKKPIVQFIEHGRKTRWYLNGHLHRADGPAIEGADGSKRVVPERLASPRRWSRCRIRGREQDVVPHGQGCQPSPVSIKPAPAFNDVAPLKTIVKDLENRIETLEGRGASQNPPKIPPGPKTA